MNIYNQYAAVYDRSGQIAFSLKMIPYLDALLQRHPAPARSMADLACGTGTVALAFAQQGWQVCGVDGSTAMLDQARRKANETALHPLWIEQDMRSFALPHPVALVTCLYDSLNYMLSLEDLQQVFYRITEALQPGGVFMGDLNTVNELEQGWNGNTFFVDGSEQSLVMASQHDMETGCSTVHLVGFVRQSNGLYTRFDELHTEAAYSDHDVHAALAAAGLIVEAAYECFGFDIPDAQTRRGMWVARKPLARAPAA